MKFRFMGCAVLLGWMLFCGPARLAMAETSTETIYKQGLQSYYDGNYQQAIESFERLLMVPLVHENIFFNLGCAYFRLGKMGPALYNFERAHALDPNSDDIAFNRAVAQKLAVSKVKDVLHDTPNDPAWMSFLKLFSSTTWAIVLLCAWWVAWSGVLSLRYLDSGALRSGVVATTVIAFVLSGVLGAVLWARVSWIDQARYGIVLSDRIAVREGPTATARTLFNVHAGLKVGLQVEENAWVRVHLANGLEGWVERHTIGVL